MSCNCAASGRSDFSIVESRNSVTTNDRIIVVGAGPVGLMAALALVRQGIPVLVIEAEPGLTHDLRAGSFHPPTLEMMTPYGITQRMHETGIVVPRWQVRDRHDGTVIEFDLGLLKDETPYPYRLHLEQHRLTPIILDLLRHNNFAEIRFGCRFVDLQQAGDRVDAVVERADGTRETLACRYLIGADGGRSAVRKSIDMAFEGFTWPERFLVVSTTYDLAAHGFASNAYVADPDEWVALFKMPGEGPPGLWRLAFPTNPDEPDESLLAVDAIEDRLQRFLPRPERYPVMYKSFYRVHQRVAADFRRNRVLLAGDAAHVNNPLGAFGLNSGIHDAINLTEKLGRVWRREADDTALDHYVRQRRTVTVEQVQAMSIRNKRLLEERDPEIRRQHLDEMRRTAESPELARKFLLGSSMIAGVRRASAIA
jgi:3-(3-hydroxy-phenyl)propionate hydroxylase